MIKRNTWTEKYLYIFAAALLGIQPVLDVCSYWLIHFELATTPVLLIRMAVLGITALTAFYFSQRKRVYFIAAGICLFILAGHIFACLQVGYSSPVSDITNFVRVVQMPVIVLCLISFMRRSERCFEGMQLGLTIALLIILGVEIVSTLTGTDPHTYQSYDPKGSGIGIIGWFYGTNSQSNNLSVLLPLTLGWQLSRSKRSSAALYATAVLGLAALYFFSTRLAYMGIFIVTLGIFISLMLNRRKDWKFGCFMLAASIFFLIMMPHSPMMQHLKLNTSAQVERQGWLDASLGEDIDEVKELINKENSPSHEDSSTPASAEDEHGMSEEERRLLIEKLTPVYETYVPDFVKIFGAEKTMEMYNYTINVNDFSGVRAKKLMFAEMLMDNSPFSAKLFGLELSRFTVGENIYDVENDFHGIYYLYGIMGLAAYILFLLYFVWLIFWALIKDAKKYFTIEAAGCGIAFLMCMAHAYNTSGVLRRPNASIYLSAILAGLYFLVRIRSYPDSSAPEALEQPS